MTASKSLEKLFGILLFAGVLLSSCFELFNIAWGTGVRFSGFSPVWFILFMAFCVFCILMTSLLVYGSWNEKFRQSIVHGLIDLRESSSMLRVSMLMLALAAPIWFFQFSMWGIVFHGIYFRLLVWLIVIVLLSIFLTRGAELVQWANLLSALVISASAFSIFANLKYVTNNPFSLGWSEGNRLWDYSMLFGRDRYIYPMDKNIFVLLEPGRQFVGALPFLFSQLSIGAARAWIGLLGILPYLLLGFISFRSLHHKKRLWVLMGLWTFLFLGQGPIHPPLVLGAALVSLAWGSSFWLAIPLMLISGYFISISRFTWVFAPAVWIVLLELTQLKPGHAGLLKQPAIKRSLVLAFSSLAGSIILPLFISLPSSSISSGNAAPSILMITESLRENLTRQALLWYRLLPNQTYHEGILVGTFLAAAPLTCLLYYLVQKKGLINNGLQKLGIILSSFAFLGVGLIISAKIGGGGDLHNIDMFLINLFFTMVIVVFNGGDNWLETVKVESKGIKLLIMLSIVIPALGPLQAMRSYDFSEKAVTLVILTDSENERTLELYPSQNVIDETLNTIQAEADGALEKGDVLFLDQRQLLTFGYITNVPLIPEYEKKVLMEQAMASDRVYFDQFYRDLKEHRFSLIISQPLVTSKKGDTFQFGEENDAWLNWVSKPLLCHYQIKETFREAGVQLLIPREGAPNCIDKYP
jgi:hypothetical protein